MEVSRLYTVLFAAFVLMFVQNASCKPRDATVQIQRSELEEISRLEDFKKIETPAPSVSTDIFPTVKPEIHRDVFPGRVACQYEEVTEDPICQEHCLPKGYSYGVCVSKTCSCI